MAKREGATTVVVGGKEDVPQQYCGVVGGQSIRFPTIDTEIKVSQHALDSFFDTETQMPMYPLSTECRPEESHAGATGFVRVPATAPFDSH